MLPEQLVSSDSAKIDFNTFFNLIGVAVEINDYSQFRKHYFDTISELKEKYSVPTLPNVVKRKTISKYIPSFNQRDFLRELVTNLLDSDTVSFIQVTETFLGGIDKVRTYNKEMKASEFMRDILPHYYALVPVWKYLQNNEQAVRNFLIDNIDGKITPVWREVGKSAEMLQLVPHGDEIYPSISFCDLLCEYIRREVHTIKAREIKEHFENKFPSKAVSADFVSDVSHLAPKYPYTINSQNHYPHPIIFLESSQIWSEKEDKNTKKAIIEDSQIFRLCLEYAERNSGCVTFLDVMNHQRILKKGDIILCMDDAAFQRAERLLKLNKTKGVSLVKIEDAYTLLTE